MNVIVMHCRRFYRHLELESKQSDAAVPPLDEILKRITEPDLEFVSENKSIIYTMNKHFEHKENPKLKKSARQLLREKPSGSNKEDGNAGISGAQAVKYSIKRAPIVNIKGIGDLTPIIPFKILKPSCLEETVPRMKDKILDLLRNSHEGDNYLKEVEYIATLLKGSILVQKPTPYNCLMHYLYTYFRDKGTSNFPQLLALRELTLISRSEAADRFHVPA